MKLTGKTLIAFEKWYFKKYCNGNMKYEDLMPYHKEDVFGWLYRQNNTIIYAVYVDFFDSYEIFINVINNIDNTIYCRILLIDEAFYGKDRNDALEKALIKADEIFKTKYGN